MVDCISKTEIEDISLTPEQIRRIEEISSTSVMPPVSILAELGHPEFSASLGKILNDLAANSERLPPDFEKVLHDNIEDLYEN